MAFADECSRKLRELYDQEHISVVGFDCKHRANCENNANTSLLHGAEGYVGPQYGESMKVVFMSLDLRK